MAIRLLDNSLKVEVFYDDTDRDFNDNICVHFSEICPDDERIFRGDETHIYLTVTQAERLAAALISAAEKSKRDHKAEA